MNKTVLITGVSSGLGLSLLNELIKLNYNVIGLSRNVNNIKPHENLKLIECDISNKNSVNKAFSMVDKVDYLINNASIFTSKKFIEHSENDIDQIIDTNLKGTIFCTLECLKIMESGRIINIGSVSGLHGIENQTIYSSTKFGLIGFSESLSQELKKINITTICPGGIKTPLWNVKNQYNGNFDDLLETNDIVSTVLFVMGLSSNVVLKEITIFPKCEWH